MSDYLSNLVNRNLGRARVLEPRPLSRFEPEASGVDVGFLPGMERGPVEPQGGATFEASPSRPQRTVETVIPDMGDRPMAEDDLKVRRPGPKGPGINDARNARPPERESMDSQPLAAGNHLTQGKAADRQPLASPATATSPSTAPSDPGTVRLQAADSVPQPAVQRQAASPSESSSSALTTSEPRHPLLESDSGTVQPVDPPSAEASKYRQSDALPTLRSTRQGAGPRTGSRAESTASSARIDASPIQRVAEPDSQARRDMEARPSEKAVPLRTTSGPSLVRAVSIGDDDGVDERTAHLDRTRSQPLAAPSGQSRPPSERMTKEGESPPTAHLNDGEHEGHFTAMPVALQRDAATAAEVDSTGPPTRLDGALPRPTSAATEEVETRRISVTSKSDDGAQLLAPLQPRDSDYLSAAAASTLIRAQGVQPESPATIQVTIGRIEVRAAPPSPAAKKPRQASQPAGSTLDEYLRRRANGGEP